MRRWFLILLFSWFAGLPFPLDLRAEAPGPLDLAPFARVTASGTRNTFLGLWPRETDDAPYTVRDGDRETGWKIPVEGEERLTLDFSPLGHKPPRLSILDAEWNPEPEGSVRLRAYAFCGGPLVREEAWTATDKPLALASPVEADCLELVFQDAGPAALLELRVYAAPAEGVPAISEVRVEGVPEGNRGPAAGGTMCADPQADRPDSDRVSSPVGTENPYPPLVSEQGESRACAASVVQSRSLRIAWTPQGTNTHHVEVHYVTVADIEDGADSRQLTNCAAVNCVGVDDQGDSAGAAAWPVPMHETGSAIGGTLFRAWGIFSPNSEPERQRIATRTASLPARGSPCPGQVSGRTLVAIAGPDGFWDGPFPSGGDAHAVLVPVAPDGVRGEAHCLALPSAQLPVLGSSGVVEGFYGRPWSHAERRSLMLFLARAGLGLYIYAPKNDPLHRDQWRVPYDGQALDRFEKLLALGRAVGVEFSLGISPGRDMDTEDQTERAILLDKLDPFVGRGFRHFTLLFDDIEFDLGSPVDRELAVRHVDLANWLADRLTEAAGGPVSLWFVPTVYSTERQLRWPGGTDYLEELAGLATGVMLMWTGTDTFSKTLEAADLAEVSALTGRLPVIWENEHATDGGDGFFGKLYLAPYVNRSKDLVGAVEGIVANPMILGAANRLMLGTYAGYLYEPVGYLPERAREEFARLESGHGPDLDLAVRVARFFHGCAALGFPGINLPRCPDLDRAIDDFRAGLRAGKRAPILERGGRLLEVAAGLAATQDELYHSGLDVSLVDDLWVPADRLTHEGLALLWLLRWTGSALSGVSEPAAWDQAGELLLRALVDRYPVSLLKVEIFGDFLKRHPPRALGFVPPAIEEPPARAVAGEAWRYRPAAAAGLRVRIFGLAGSEVTGESVSWTPPHPGVFRPIVVASGPDGWAWRALEVVVEPAQISGSPPVAAPGGKHNGGWCFVATAAYGTAAEGKIRVLRGFRDRVLLSCLPGKILVAAYYRHGPAAARFVRERPWLRACARILLLPAVGFAFLCASC